MGLERDTEAYPLTQRAAMKTWETGVPFRETLREEAAVAGLKIDEARLDEVCRPERFVKNLSGMFDRLAELS
jgi:adenylosuccinate lyase